MILNWIARTYFWFYCKFMQRPPGEPYTRQSARFEERWPTIFWLFWLAVLGEGDILILSNGCWPLLIPLNLLASWWFHHILVYRVVHTTDNEPYSRMFLWARKRLEHDI